MVNHRNFRAYEIVFHIEDSVNLAVQCMEEEKDFIQKEFYGLFKEVLIKDGRKPGNGMFEDVYHTERDVYQLALKVYKVDFFK